MFFHVPYSQDVARGLKDQAECRIARWTDRNKEVSLREIVILLIVFAHVKFTMKGEL